MHRNKNKRTEGAHSGIMGQGEETCLKVRMRPTPAKGKQNLSGEQGHGQALAKELLAFDGCWAREIQFS